MLLNKTSKLACLFLSIYSSLTFAEFTDLEKHPFYLGVIGGYGETTWQGLVPAKKNQNPALMLSTPIRVEEGGTTWGVLVGYEFTPNFAIEANYLRYADAQVHFDESSIFSFLHNGQTTLTTQSELAGLMGKLQVPIPHTKIRLFSSVGVAGVHRKDIVVNDWNAGPTFGAGANYALTEHLMAELAGSFTAGYGESQLSPVDTYYPFLYSVGVHLIYRI